MLIAETAHTIPVRGHETRIQYMFAENSVVIHSLSYSIGRSEHFPRPAVAEYNSFRSSVWVDEVR